MFWQPKEEEKAGDDSVISPRMIFSINVICAVSRRVARFVEVVKISHANSYKYYSTYCSVESFDSQGAHSMGGYRTSQT